MKRDKTKDIIESVLPATRNGADSARKDKASAKRRGRRKIGQQVRNIRSCDDFYDEASDLEFYPDTEINYIRDRRRDFDNLGALLRWAHYHCDHQLAGRPDIEKYYWFKNILPDTLQGRHALGHVKDACLELDDRYYAYSSAYYVERRREYQSKKEREREDVQAAIVRILTEGYHKRFNQTIKRAQPDPFILWLSDPKKYPYAPKRVLEGWHDVEEFTDWILKHRRHSRVWLEHSTNNYIDVLNKFIDSL